MYFQLVCENFIFLFDKYITGNVVYYARTVTVVCLSRIRSRKLSDIGGKFRHLYSK